MAMNPLKNLVNNVPDWLQRLDDFSGQKDRRQAELAAVAVAEGKSAETKSLRKKGSTESLNPKEHLPVVHAEPPTNEDILDDAAPENKAQTPVNAEVREEYGWDADTLVDSGEVPVVSDSPHENVKLHDATENTTNTSEKIEVPELHPPDPSYSNNQTNTATKRHLQRKYGDDEGRRGRKSAIVQDTLPLSAEVECEYAAAESKRQTPVNTKDHKVHITSSGPSHQQQEIIKATQAWTRAEVRKKPKSPSMMSNEGALAAYRTRQMIIVYYNDHVSSFFNDLAKFASSSQDLIRKAKLAARIAQITKFVEQDISEDGNNDDALLLFQYMMLTRRISPKSISRPGANNRPLDVYDRLNTRLKSVQTMCEHCARQFLRDGDCNAEIIKVQKRLTEVLKMAKTEMERLEREEPELAKERHDMIAGLQEDSPTTTKQDGKLEAMDQMETIEVDPKYVGPNINETDEGICMELELP
ncbi:hypothetical protein FGLOB1_7623 [Fusarium globosum]|uniref:Uncharacterized protein n=1 Tax=Fusarium globosum TaxID=78864 RepID=A0A8H5Y5J4_9HYPO|nr:hypothetical protein FGLOB1_7623 [Fusarium globosum]